MKETIRNCPDCAVLPGDIHVAGCDVERCSVCGRQKLGCDCKGHDTAFARWTGFWPGALEADSLGIDMNKLYSSGLYEYFFIKPTIGVRQVAKKNSKTVGKSKENRSY